MWGIDDYQCKDCLEGKEAWKPMGPWASKRRPRYPDDYKGPDNKGDKRYHGHSDLRPKAEPASLSASPAPTTCCPVPEFPKQTCDINSDGRIDILDIQTYVNHVNGSQDWGIDPDLDENGLVDESDVNVITEKVLGE